MASHLTRLDRLSWIVLAAAVALLPGCPSSSPPGLSDVVVTDEAPDGTPGDVPTDLPPGPCATNADCPGGQVCDTALRACMPCRTNGQCGDGQRCADGACVPLVTCGAEAACPEGLVCDPSAGACVECVTSVDCPANRRCEDRICVDLPTACGLAFACPTGTVCDKTTNECVACLKDGDCPTGRWCDEAARECLPQACAPGATACLSNSVATCRADGSGWDLGDACPVGTTCTNGRCEAVAGKTCAEALQCALSMNVSPDQALASCGAQATGAAGKAFSDLVACAVGVCGPTASWNGYGCAVQTAFQNACQGLYKACVACAPSCDGKDCGDDGCGGSCGQCIGCEGQAAPDACVDGRCMQPCCPNCNGRQCGPDGCGGLCGACLDGQKCDPAQGLCIGTCQRACTDPSTGAALQCGPDGCGGVCGSCAPDQSCNAGRCVGSLSCETGIQCVLDCGGSTPEPIPAACWDQCRPTGNPVQAQRFETLRSCVAKACGDLMTGDCVQKYLQSPTCASAWAVCQQCTPNCMGRACGPDGCGGSCGTCDDTAYCQGFQCIPYCRPSCEGLQCGSDGCGGLCGTCPSGTACENGRCQGCVPSCVGPDGQRLACGDDGCGGVCGVCKAGTTCVGGTCIGGCTPSCNGKTCGPDGCGGTCGTCAKGTFCGATGTCQPLCTPSCQGRKCGPDGCGGTCGACSSQEYCDGAACQPFRSCSDMFQCWSACATTDQACIQACWMDASPEAQAQYQDLVACLVQACGPSGTDACYTQAYYGACRGPYTACLNCTPNCTGRECGTDGCGGTCGTCPNSAACSSAGLCPCQPSCANRECGPDQCGGACGTCAPTEVCTTAFTCSCSGSCTGRQCGDDGCGHSCGTCAPGQACKAGTCISTCTPRCLTADGMRLECGDDGCGGSCGTCRDGTSCQKGLCLPVCTPSCQGRTCGDDGCGGQCGYCREGTVCDGKSCIVQCTPQCFGRQCGSDGCGGSCGWCPPGLACDATTGFCMPGQQDGCTATNTGGCGGCSCEASVCSQDPYCCRTAWDDVCVEECRRNGGCQACTPSCVTSSGMKKACGDNGCGGSCGTCPAGTACTTDGQCLATPQGLYCPQILECAFACPGFDTACVQGCMAQGNAASQQVFMTFAQCVIQYCGLPPATDCVYQTLNSRCYGEYSSCKMDGQIVPM